MLAYAHRGAALRLFDVNSERRVPTADALHVIPDAILRRPAGHPEVPPVQPLQGA